MGSKGLIQDLPQNSSRQGEVFKNWLIKRLSITEMRRKKGTNLTFEAQL